MSFRGIIRFVFLFVLFGGTVRAAETNLVAAGKVKAMDLHAFATPQFEGIQIIGGTLYMHFIGEAFRTYTLQYRDDFTQGAWLTLRVFRATATTSHLYATDAYVGIPKRCYRLAATP